MPSDDKQTPDLNDREIKEIHCGKRYRAVAEYAFQHCYDFFNSEFARQARRKFIGKQRCHFHGMRRRNRGCGTVCMLSLAVKIQLSRFKNGQENIA